MPLRQRSEGETPVFEPSADSSVAKTVHAGASSLKARLISNFVIPAALTLAGRGRFKIPTGPNSEQGPQKLEPALPKDGGRAEGVVVRKYDLDERLLADARLKLTPDWALTEIVPAKPGTREAVDVAGLKRTILVFPGGGFHSPMVSPQTSVYIGIAKRLGDARLLIVPYELSPWACAATSYPRFVAIHDQVRREARSLGHELIAAGDSAGGTIVTCLPRAIHDLHPLLFPTADGAASQDAATLLPDQIVALAPAADSTIPDTAEMRALERKDCLLSLSRCRYYMREWSGSGTGPTRGEAQCAHLTPELLAHLPQPDPQLSADFSKSLEGTVAEHPLMSPVFEDAHADSSSFALLHRAGTRLVVNAGTADVLYSGILRYVEKLEAARVPTRYIEGTDGMHVYPILVSFSAREGTEALDLIADAIKSNTAEAK